MHFLFECILSDYVIFFVYFFFNECIMCKCAVYKTHRPMSGTLYCFCWIFVIINTIQIFENDDITVHLFRNRMKKTNSTIHVSVPTDPPVNIQPL